MYGLICTREIPLCQHPLSTAVMDLKNGDVVHSLNIHGVVEELYDVVTLPKIRRTMAIGFRNDEIRRVISIGEQI